MTVYFKLYSSKKRNMDVTLSMVFERR